MKKTILLIAAVILAVFAVVGAGCIGADPIVGEWKAGNMPVTFNEDEMTLKGPITLTKVVEE